MTDPDDLTGGSFSDPPNEKYKEFFNKFKEIDITDPKEFKPIHLLAYFVRKYQSLYNAKWYEQVEISKHRKLGGVAIIWKPEFASGTNLKPRLAKAVQEIPKWRRELSDWLEGEQKEPFKRENLASGLGQPLETVANTGCALG